MPCVPKRASIFIGLGAQVRPVGPERCCSDLWRDSWRPQVVVGTGLNTFFGKAFSLVASAEASGHFQVGASRLVHALRCIAY